MSQQTNSQSSKYQRSEQEVNRLLLQGVDIIKHWAEKQLKKT